MITPNQDGSNTTPSEKKSTSETGHARNLAAFDKLLKIAERHQDKYAPPGDDISLMALKKLYANAEQAIDDCKTAETNFNRMTDLRSDLFKQLRPLSMSAINNFRSTSVAESAIKNAETHLHKIQGRPAKISKKTLLSTDPEATHSISTSQQSYVQLVQHFNSLCKVLSIYPEYAPNEKAIQMPSLLTFGHQLDESNENINTVISDWSGARINRNKIMYQPKTGMLDITKRVKKYMASLFGTGSAEYKEVDKIRFRNPD